MYLLVEESRQTLCGGLGGGVCHLDLQLGLVGQAVAEEGGRAPAHVLKGRLALLLWPGPASNWCTDPSLVTVTTIET